MRMNAQFTQAIAMAKASQEAAQRDAEKALRIMEGEESEEWESDPEGEAAKGLAAAVTIPLKKTAAAGPQIKKEPGAARPAKAALGPPIKKEPGAAPPATATLTPIKKEHAAPAKRAQPKNAAAAAAVSKGLEAPPVDVAMQRALFMLRAKPEAAEEAAAPKPSSTASRFSDAIKRKSPETWHQKPVSPPRRRSSTATGSLAAPSTSAPSTAAHSTAAPSTATPSTAAPPIAGALSSSRPSAVASAAMDWVAASAARRVPPKDTSGRPSDAEVRAANGGVLFSWMRPGAPDGPPWRAPKKEEAAEQPRSSDGDYGVYTAGGYGGDDAGSSYDGSDGGHDSFDGYDGYDGSHDGGYDGNHRFGGYDGNHRFGGYGDGHDVGYDSDSADHFDGHDADGDGYGGRGKGWSQYDSKGDKSYPGKGKSPPWHLNKPAGPKPSALTHSAVLKSNWAATTHAQYASALCLSVPLACIREGPWQVQGR